MLFIVTHISPYFKLINYILSAWGDCSRVFISALGGSSTEKVLRGDGLSRPPSILFIRSTKSVPCYYPNYLTSLLLNIFTVKKRNTPETTKETIIALKAVTLSVAATVCPKSWSGI